MNGTKIGNFIVSKIRMLCSIEFSSGFFFFLDKTLDIFLIVLSFHFQVRGHRSILSGRSSPVDHWPARKLATDDV